MTQAAVDTNELPINEQLTGIIEPDDDTGSGCETGWTQESETASLTSSLQEWMTENGRRYHIYYGPDKNLMPTDTIEQERLDIHHEGMLLISGGDLYKAPVKNAQRVLDIGTGTGIWAIDYAFDHPEAEVIGTDLSPIQPNWVPPNCRFEVDDFELKWTYKKESFDFIHGRNIAHSVKDWSRLLPSIMEHLKPGAWFELAEVGSVVGSDDNSVPEDWPPKRCLDLAGEGLAKIGRVSPDGEWMEKLLQDGGFVDVKVHAIKQPLTPWPRDKALKQSGALMNLQAEHGYHAYMMSLLTRILGWTSEDADALCKAAHAAHYAKKTGIHAYNTFWIAYGRKPFE